jgi:hypothetical protein
MLKHEALLRLGYDDKALAIDDNKSMSSKSSSTSLVLHG